LQAQEALIIIKNIYVDQNNPDAYFKYAEKISFANISSDEKETMLFAAAEQLYLEGKKTEAVPALHSFLKQYPQSVFNNTVRWYYADCALLQHQYDTAIQQYELLIQNDKTENGKKSMMIVAQLYFQQHNYQSALSHYQSALSTVETEQEKNDALIGIMRCYEQLDNQTQLKNASVSVMKTNNLSLDIASEAHLNLARVAMKQKDYNNAEKEYTVLKTNTSGAIAAEARYVLAWLLFKKSQYEKSMNATFDLINDYPNEDFWVVKSFLLLADNYIAQKNTFQATQTLKSIVENCQIPELKTEAEEKLSKISSNE
jgi:TolA-binding protein